MGKLIGGERRSRLNRKWASWFSNSFKLKGKTIKKKPYSTMLYCLYICYRRNVHLFLQPFFIWFFLIFVHRPYWRCYFPNTQAIIYVVDSSDVDRLVIAKEEFHAILEVFLIPDLCCLYKLYWHTHTYHDHCIMKN